MWWHAHSRWLRATVYGALIILPKLGSSYPFATPKQEFPVLLGEFLQNYLFNLPHISSHLTDSLTSNVVDLQENGLTETPMLFSGRLNSLEDNPMYLLHIPLTVSLVIFIGAPAKVCQTKLTLIA